LNSRVRRRADKQAAEERTRQTAARLVADAVATTIKSDRAAKNANQFDGDWKVAGQGGDGCRFKNWKYRISIQNDRILVPQLPPGNVDPAGDFTYRYIAVGWRHEIEAGVTGFSRTRSTGNSSTYLIPILLVSGPAVTRAFRRFGRCYL